MTSRPSPAMEAGRGLIPSPNLPRIRTSLSSNSVPALHDPARRTITSLASTSIVQTFPASVFPQEQDDYRAYYAIKEENIARVTLDRQRGLPFSKEKEKYVLDQYRKYFEHRLLYQPSFRLPYAEENPVQAEQTILNFVRPGDVLVLAKRAMIASRKAASLAEKSNIISSEFEEFNIFGLDADRSAKDILIKDQTTVRSKRLLERQSKKRKVPKNPSNAIYEISSSMDTNLRKKIDKRLKSNDPLRLFLWGPETTQLLTVKEEKDLFIQIQEFMRLGEIKQRLEVQFNRQPTLVEWAEAVGMSCQVLQSSLQSGKRSREKMIYANFRLVVHIARHYEGKGLNIQDLLQEGSEGLMKSLEKFKPEIGCRFPTYAYWWIRQSIKKAIFQNSRTIRLPENVYALLKRINNARMSCIQEGHSPTNEELAKRVGISVEKLISLLSTTRIPVSIQNYAWTDQNVTLQAITADPKVETPDLVIAKKLMRQHARNLLSILTPRERHIIESHFGIYNYQPKSLAEIGVVYGVSKERVRQIENRAMEKLKGCLTGQGLEAYVELLI